MLEVTEIEDGVFRVKVTAMHYDCIDKMSKMTEICSEATLAMMIGCGMVELAGFAGDGLVEPGPPIPPLSDADDETY